MENKKRMIYVDVVLTGIATFKECYNGAGMKPWIVEHIQTALQMVERFVKESPTVDAVEVVHGYTVIVDKPGKVLLDRKCGICDQLMLATDNYCPMCGAKNEGEKIDGLLFADMEEIIDA